MYFEWKYVVCCVAHTGTAVLRAVLDAPSCLNITGRQVLVCRFGYVLYLYLEIHYMPEYTCKLFNCTAKGKANPLQAWTGPGGSRRLMLTDFKTAHEGGKVVSPTHQSPLPPQETLDAESTPGP